MPVATVGLTTAFAAGLLSFLSPCVLPLVPGYVAFISGVSLEEMEKAVDRTRNMRKAVAASLLFGAGFTVVFVLMGATATLAGQFLFSRFLFLQRAAGVLIILFGLHVLGILPIRFLYRTMAVTVERRSVSLGGAFFVGVAFAFGWTPCIGPVLAGILAFAGTQQTVQEGMLLLLTYSFGLGIPFLLTAVAMNMFRTVLQQVRKYMRHVELGSGALLILIGVLIATDNLSWLAYTLGIPGIAQ
ncbi:MAG: cytochrome c biogenesis protein CcdA [Candidatus Tectomicrobia bacterium]|uniref:Cytochrome c biogenesis protein CcdA n=1 Tax=Tectimicrobiota bacterium TaxID=2528274 RepID=A0A932ML84_UNCTE|nr:cytochrome c biogenesis protein CcdA [Candidatus Tectomicrobia bacterium]